MVHGSWFFNCIFHFPFAIFHLKSRIFTASMKTTRRDLSGQAKPGKIGEMENGKCLTPVRFDVAENKEVGRALSVSIH
jgi:hypothetical protein